MIKRTLCFLFLLFTLCGCMESDSNIVTICPEKSVLIDFYEEDGIVHIICSITLYNETNKDILVKISGFSQEDVNNGLLLNPHLSGINKENQSEFFLLKPYRYNEFVVDLCGEYGGNFQKADRLVPDVIEIEIVS